MAWSPVFLGVIILLSSFPGLGFGGRPMPKLADWKLCADEECSCKSWVWGDWGCGLLASVEGAVDPFYSFPRPHLHGCGPAGLRGP